jgi:hypothetical protein
LQGSIAQLSDNDPFRFSGGLDGGMKVRAVTILPHPTMKFGTCQVLARQVSPYANCYLQRIQRDMRIDHGWRQGNYLPPVFWAAAVFCQPQSGL